ncbi:hypothetical protein P405_23715 [Streptomyces sp. FR-008]|nr:hypothetical protein P405_23715 [Streptomyces sp. FR-008]
MRSLIQIIQARRVESGEVAVRGLVVSGGDASPGLELVDQALDGEPTFTFLLDPAAC